MAVFRPFCVSLSIRTGDVPLGFCSFAPVLLLISILFAVRFVLGWIRIWVGIRLRLGLHSRLPVLLFLLLLFLPLCVSLGGRLVLDEAKPGHGAVDGQCVDQVEVVHADQVQQEVPTEVVLDDAGTMVLGEQQAGLVHLVVCYEAGGRNEEETTSFQNRNIVSQH